MNENEKERIDNQGGGVVDASEVCSRRNGEAVQSENAVAVQKENNNTANDGETLQSVASGDSVPQGNTVTSPRGRRRLCLAEKALTVELSAIVSGGMSVLIAPVAFVVAALLVLYTVAAPFAGMIMGVTALLDRERTKRDTVFAAVSIALPAAAVLIIILCFSTGVFVIRFM